MLTGKLPAMPFTLTHWVSVSDEDNPGDNPSPSNPASPDHGTQEGTFTHDIDQLSGQIELVKTHDPTTPASTGVEPILSPDSDPPIGPQRRTSRFRAPPSDLADPSSPAGPTRDIVDDTRQSISGASTAMDIDSHEDQAELAESPELPTATKKRGVSSLLDGNDDMTLSNKRTRSKRVASLTAPEATTESPPARNTRSSNRTVSTAQIKQMAPVTRSRMQTTSEALTMLNKRGDEELQDTTANATSTHKMNTISDGDAALKVSIPANRYRSKATPPANNNIVDIKATEVLQNASVEAGSAPETKSPSGTGKEVKPVCEARPGCHIAFEHYFHCTVSGCNRTEPHRPPRESVYKHGLASSSQQAPVTPSSPPQPPRSVSSSPVNPPPPSSPESPHTAEVIQAAARRMMNASRFLAQTSISISTPFDYDSIKRREVEDAVRRLKRTLDFWETVSKQVMTAFDETIEEMTRLGKQKEKAT